MNAPYTASEKPRESASSSRHSSKITDEATSDSVANWNFTWATALIDGLISSGAKNIVMSPGAQAAPLMMAARANAQARISVIIDERSAAFYALGLARASGEPTVIICTSGTAVGQIYPAVIEASAALAPLIVLAADRAPERQDCCSAQATDQVRAFGTLVRASHHLPPPDGSISSLPNLAARIVEQSLYPNPGPVFVNLPFREPLYAKTLTKYTPTAPLPAVARPVLQPHPQEIQTIAELISGRPGLILCGSNELHGQFSAAVGELATALGSPIIADPLSGLRFGNLSDTTVISRADSLPRLPAFKDDCHPEWVIAFGGPMISQTFQNWLKALSVREFIVVDDTTRWPDPNRRASRMVRAEPEAFCRALAPQVHPAPAHWAERFAAFEQNIDAAARLGSGNLLWEAPIIERLLAAAPEGAVVFSGNSMSVRDFDTFSGTTPRPLRLLANRGANGIDGNLATVLGIAASGDRPTLAMMGDVSLAHDMGSLQISNKLDVVLVVLNNGGGAIFDYQGAVQTHEYGDFLCPPKLDIKRVAEACGWQHWRAGTQAEFDTALSQAMDGKGCRIIEAVIDRLASVARHRSFWSTVGKIGAEPAAAE